MRYIGKFRNDRLINLAKIEEKNYENIISKGKEKSSQGHLCLTMCIKIYKEIYIPQLKNGHRFNLANN